LEALLCTRISRFSRIIVSWSAKSPRHLKIRSPEEEVISTLSPRLLISRQIFCRSALAIWIILVMVRLGIWISSTFVSKSLRK
jgi:hypothetical protein